ncbi:HAD-IC family P-type ATPase [Desulfobacca acetoxidans]
MLVHKLLLPENIELNFNPPPEKILKALVRLVYSRAKLAVDSGTFEEEELHLLHSYLGEGLAILHNLSEAVAQTLLILVLSPAGVGLNGQSCQVLAVLITPLKESGSHFQLLARLTALLRNRRLREELMAKESATEIWRAIRREEESGYENYWVLSREEILKELTTGFQGLSPEEARHRLEEIGPNRIARVRRRPLFLRFGTNFVNLFAILLWAASGFAYLAGIKELAAAIPLVILINAIFSFWQEYRAEKAIEVLGKLLPSRTRVCRGGEVREVEAAELVPGDIIVLEAGDQVPADSRLIEAQDFRVDNSALTGESRPAYKTAESVEDGQEFLWTEMPNLVFAGTAALSGVARGVVLATGMDTQLGNIAALTQEVKEKPSPLQREMQFVVKVQAVVAVTIGLLFFLVAVLTGKLAFFNSLIFAIGLIVAFVPEGLLPTLTLALAMGVQRMARKNALVKRLSAVETLGAATVICTDKTGTLTTNEVMVAHLWLAGNHLTVTGSGFKLPGRLEQDNSPLSPPKLGSPLLTRISHCAILCNNASLSAGDEKVSGDPTEAALLVLAAKIGKDFEAIRRGQPRLKVFPFESVRKRMSVLHAAPDGGVSCWVKGAPESVIPLCTTITEWDGQTRPLTQQDRARLSQELSEMAQKGLRLLTLAYKPVETLDLGLEEAESNLSFLAITGMEDPPRPEVSEAIDRCHKAGIRIVMITGDFGGTAGAVASEIGMQLGKAAILTGEEVSRLSEVQLRGLLKRSGDKVFARISPQEKLRIVAALLNLGEIVAVTGDGVNDGPALKAADIGVAMGQRGTEVSKEAASIVLTDDNFATIVAAIEEGRAVYANIKKFITYIFNSNIPEAVPFVLFVLLGIPLPLNIMQILAVDLGTDLLPGLALGVEPPEPGIMNRPPRSRRDRLIDWPLARRFTFLGLLNAAAALCAFFFVYLSAGWRPGLEMAASGPLYERATTMCLAGIIASQIGNGLAIRTDRESVFKVGLFSNRLLIGGIVSEVLILLALSYLPLLQGIFGTAPLTGKDLMFLLSFPPVMLLAEELRKAWGRRQHQSH